MTRRELLAGALATPALWGKRHFDRSRISAITDEIGKTHDDAIAFAKQYSLQWVELRNVPGTNKEYIYQDEATLKAHAASFRAHGLRVSFLNSSLMKFPWPGIEPARRRPEPAEALTKRRAGEATRFEKRMEDLKKAIHAAHIMGVDKLRVFTGTRAVEPKGTFPKVAEIIEEMAFVAGKEKVFLLVENEGSCNVASSAETAEIMKLMPSKWIGINWDPQNVMSQKEVPYPDGYSLLPKKRILNVQFKGRGIMPESKDRLDWKAILQGLDKDGYKGQVGLETHIFDGTLIQAAHISMKEMLRIIDEI